MTLPATATRTILVVDDDADTREAIAGVLHADGYQVLEAGDGQEAWNLITQHGAPDLILLDVMMPRMNGKEFLRLKAEHAELDQVPVVVLTAGDDPPDGAMIVRKPIILRMLLGVVQRAVRYRPWP